MTNPLTTLYRERAELAGSAPDPEAVLAEVVERAEHRGRRRRQVTAATGGSVAVIAIVTAALLVTSGDGRDEAAAPPSRVASAPPPAPARLVSVAPAPKRAPLSVSLVPRGYRYLSYASDATGYGPAGANRDPNVFVGKVTLVVGERYDAKTLPGRIAGYPARITAQQDKDFQWTVVLNYSKKIQLTIQVPRTARLTREDVRTMADTLDVRDVSHHASG